MSKKKFQFLLHVHRLIVETKMITSLCQLSINFVKFIFQINGVLLYRYEQFCWAFKHCCRLQIQTILLPTTWLNFGRYSLFFNKKFKNYNKKGVSFKPSGNLHLCSIRWIGEILNTNNQNNIVVFWDFSIKIKWLFWLFFWKKLTKQFVHL